MPLNPTERAAARDALRTVWDALTEVEHRINAAHGDGTEHVEPWLQSLDHAFNEAAQALAKFQREHITEPFAGLDPIIEQRIADGRG